MGKRNGPEEGQNDLPGLRSPLLSIQYSHTAIQELQWEEAGRVPRNDGPGVQDVAGYRCGPGIGYRMIAVLAQMRYRYLCAYLADIRKAKKKRIDHRTEIEIRWRIEQYDS